LTEQKGNNLIDTETHATSREDIHVSEPVLDLETRVTMDDHQALRLWLRWLSCTARIENQIRARLREHFDTTLPRFDLMAQLERDPDGLRMSELSKRLMVTGGSITGITDQLEHEGLAIRIPVRTDRRAVIVKLTPMGLERFRKIAAEHELWIIELMSALTEEEQHEMLAQFRKLKLHLSGVAAASADGTGPHQQ
jgi:DNA-binding MarR family transcriptional regulator